MMNDENEKTEQIHSRIKRSAVSLGVCAVLMAVLALAVVGNRETEKETTAPQTTAEQNVDSEKDDVPDPRKDTTMIVPATEITTAGMIEIRDETTQTTVEATTRSAPTSYLLPMGTDIGKDYSRGIPVYSAVMGDWRTHDGVDFNGADGDCVKAIADGIVKEIKDDPLMGSTIVIDHGGGVAATYCGVEPSEEIKKGVIISQGQMLGSLSAIPSESDADFPHLHLEIRVDGEIVDPLEVMGYYE